MYQKHRIGAILLMGGEGKRFGSFVPKQFHLLEDKKVYRYALDTFATTGFFDEILLVCPKKWMKETEKEAGSSAKVIEGGPTRQSSSYAALKAFRSTPDIVLIHDAVRPFVSAEIIQANLEQAILQGAVDTCIPSADTLVFSPQHKTIESIPNRADYLRGQTPQTFRYDWILKAHKKALREGIFDASDDCRLILLSGRPVAIVQGSEENFKITSELDLVLARALLKKNTREMTARL